MIIAFNQPAFIPWAGFFCRLLAADRMILLDDTLFARGFTFVNRNRLKGPQGQTWVTVPVKRKGRGLQKIKDLEIHEKPYWAGKFLATLEHLYGKSIYFDHVVAPLAIAIQNTGGGFSPTVSAMLESLIDNLGISTPLLLQSGTGIRGKGTPLLVDLARHLGARQVLFPYPAQGLLQTELFEQAGIEVKLLKFNCPVYPQFFGDFIPCLSILDMLFSQGPSCLTLLQEGYTLQPPSPNK